MDNTLRANKILLIIEQPTLSDVEKLTVETDQVAKIVIDEASGTIVMGENVRIDTVAVAQGNLVVRVEETPLVSQPSSFAPEQRP